MTCNWQKAAFLLLILLAASAAGRPARAQEQPYFVTYSDDMAEPGALEVALAPVAGIPRAGPNFLASTAEFEYGATRWWTAAFYLDGQSTAGDSAIFTGYRFENRFRPLARHHAVNPVLYVEFEDVNAADKVLKEIVGFDSTVDADVPNALARREREREIETKLILSSDYRGWNFSENFIAGKDVGGEPWEFGYALGFSRPLARGDAGRAPAVSRRRVTLGAELYGGLGNWNRFTLSGTSHYLGPAIAWELPRGVTLRLSPAFGLTDASHRALVRFAILYDIPGFGPRLAQLFRH
jgi:hypothetical protein